MVSFERICEITTRTDFSFDGLVEETQGSMVKLPDGWKIDLCGNIGSQNTFGWDSLMQGHLMHSAVYGELLEVLVETFGFPHAYLATSGGKANDFALKLAASRMGPRAPGEKRVVVSLENGFHGRTVATEGLSGTGALFAPECFLRIPF